MHKFSRSYLWGKTWVNTIHSAGCDTTMWYANSTKVHWTHCEELKRVNFWHIVTCYIHNKSLLRLFTNFKSWAFSPINRMWLKTEISLNNIEKPHVEAQEATILSLSGKISLFFNYFLLYWPLFTHRLHVWNGTGSNVPGQLGLKARACAWLMRA